MPKTAQKWSKFDALWGPWQEQCQCCGRGSPLSLTTGQADWK